MSKKLTAFVSIAALLVGGYFVVQKQSPKITPPTEKLTIAHVEVPVYALVYIAENKGYFKDEGLEVTYRNFPKGLDVLSDMLEGNSDISITYETPVIRKMYEGGELRILSTSHTSTKSAAVLSPKNKGIEVANDLKGKRIGVTKTSAYEFFLYSYLVSHGIKLSDVTIVDGSLTDWGEALKNGKVDAVATGNPFLYDIKKEFPEDFFTSLGSDAYVEHSLVTVTDDTINNKKEAVANFMKALLQAEIFYKNNNKEALDAVVAETPDLSEETIRATWDQFTPVLKLDNVLLTILNREGQWFKDNGVYTDPVPDFRKAIFTDYLKNVKPDAVTLY